MKKRFRGAFVFIPVVYAGVILLLLFLQFSDGQRFYETKNGLTLEGRMTPTVERESSTIASVRVSYNGIAFEFDEEATLSVAHSDGSASALAPIAYRSTADGFRLRFEEDLLLSFTVDPDSEEQELRVEPRVPDGLQPATELALPVSVTGGARLQEASLPGIFPIRYDSQTYHLAPPPSARLDSERGVLSFSTDDTSQIIRYVRAEPPQQDVFATWFSDDRVRISEEEYQTTIREFLDAAYRGWTDTRLNAGSGTWQMRSGSPQFSEQILTVALAEAWRRDEYTPVFTDMRRAADQHPNRVGLLSAPYLGDLRTVREKFLEADRETTRRLLELAQSRNPELFRTPDLALFALDRGSEELYREILSFVAEAEFLEVDMRQALGMLSNYYLAEFPNQESRDAFRRFADIVEARILPNLYRAEDEGFFLKTSPDRVDVYHSILAGRVLEQAGRLRDEQRLISVGRNLVVSALALADEDGFLPAVLYVGPNGLEDAEGSFGPERVYELLTDNPAYPSQISLSEEIAPGSWIWTVADFTRIDIGQGQYSFTLEYPRNRTHYIIMQGIPGFSSMQLFGQTWRNDPAFESYIKGRHYNADSDTLLVKYTDDSVERDIILRY